VHLGLSGETLQGWRCRGQGPPWKKALGAVRYNIVVVDAWCAAQPGGGGAALKDAKRKTDAERPASPADCMRSRVAGTCDTCGRRSDGLHMPVRLHGWQCSACCPVCNAAVPSGGRLKVAPEIDFDRPEARVRD